MRDPFRILGLPKTAGTADIKRAYRRLVKTYHPDAAGGGAEARARFEQISDAYRAALRQRAEDGPGIPPAGSARVHGGEAPSPAAEAPVGERPRPAETPPPAGATETGTPAGASETRTPPRTGSDFLDALRRAGRRPFQRRGDDIACTLTLPFLDAARGGPKRVTLPTGRTLDIAIPAAIEDGAQIRLRGQGEKGPAGGAPGDALVTIEIEPHPYFSRDGDDIRLALPVSIAEAVEGARIQVPTVTGKVWMRIPAGSNTGTVLRLQGRGLPGPGGVHGHQYVELLVVLPDGPDKDLAAFVRSWPAARSHDPRAAFGLS